MLHFWLIMSKLLYRFYFLLLLHSWQLNQFLGKPFNLWWRIKCGMVNLLCLCVHLSAYFSFRKLTLVCFEGKQDIKSACFQGGIFGRLGNGQNQGYELSYFHPIDIYSIIFTHEPSHLFL